MRGLREAAEFLRSGRGVAPAEPWSEEEAGHEEANEDFADVAGQAYAKRALEVAAAGGHNVLTSVQNATGVPVRPIHAHRAA